MLTTGLLTAIAGLAVLDSLNPATIAGVALILLAPVPRPASTALAYVTGAYLVVFAAGTGVFIGSGELGQVVQSAAVWVRRGALLLAALILLIIAARRLRTRTRPAVVLPRWFSPWTAGPLGVLATGADLPNAFPYLVAIERLNAAEVPTGVGVTVLALYAFVYCLPCLVLLVAGLVWRGRITGPLQRVYERLGAERVQQRSIPAVIGLVLIAGALAALAFTL
ncbi:hypothetical protein GCM10009696_00860 [Kocuria himachalensis]